MCYVSFAMATVVTPTTLIPRSHISPLEDAATSYRSKDVFKAIPVTMNQPETTQQSAPGFSIQGKYTHASSCDFSNRPD